MIAVARSGGELYAIEDGHIVCPATAPALKR
jgi:hypothetical protein